MDLLARERQGLQATSDQLNQCWASAVHPLALVEFLSSHFLGRRRVVTVSVSTGTLVIYSTDRGSRRMRER
jgi:hypothetical protein